MLVLKTRDLAHLVECHQFLRSVCLVLIEGCKFDVLRRKSLISEGPLEGIQIMGSNGDQLPTATDVLVQLVLEVDEGCV